MMGIVKQTIIDYSQALAAENWAGLSRLKRVCGFNTMQHLDTMLTAAALVWAEGTEPRRSPEFNALIKVLELMDDERMADAQQARYEGEK